MTQVKVQVFMLASFPLLELVGVGAPRLTPFIRNKR